MESFEIQAEKQLLITNINMMIEKIGKEQRPFSYLYSKDLKWLRLEQDRIIQHYNVAIKNSAKVTE